MNKKMVSMVLAAALTGVSIFPAAVQAEDSGKVTISILCDLERANVGIGGLDTGFYAALDEWAEAHPEVEISLESMNQTDYQTKITSLGAAGDMPDMFMLKGSWTKNFAENGWVKDITDVLDADPDTSKADLMRQLMMERFTAYRVKALQPDWFSTIPIYGRRLVMKNFRLPGQSFWTR